MHPKTIGGARSALLFALACGTSACGSSRSGDLFQPNDSDAGADAAVIPGEGGAPTSEPTSESTTSGSSETTSPSTTGETSDPTSALPDSGSSSVGNPTSETTDTSAPSSETSVATTDTSVPNTDGTSESDSTTTEATTSIPTMGGTSEGTVDPSSSDPTDGTSGPDTGTEPVPPSCVISIPSKTLLNGVAAPEGDRVNAPNAPFKTDITVATDAPDGSSVVLSMGGGASLLTQVTEGSAVFPGVELAPDAEYTLVATCNGELSVQSDPLVLTVDTAAPEFGVGLVPLPGQHYSPGDDENTGTPDVLDFSVCVPVDSLDAVDRNSDNVCVWTGAAGPFCGTATEDGIAPGTDGVCIPVTCPGSAPFNIDVRLTDEAGNYTTTQVGGVTCASTTPTVEIISLTDNRDTPNDVGIRLLAAGNPNPASLLQDEDAETTGAQHTVVACTNALVGSSAELWIGLQDGSLTSRGTMTVVEDESDVCPSGLDAIVTFPAVTLDNSVVVSGALQNYTVVQVAVTDTSTEVGTSPDVHVWVDPTLPTVTVLSPLRLCEDGVLPSTGADVTKSVSLRSGGVYPIEAQLIRRSDEAVIGSYTYEFLGETKSITFPLGSYTLVATAVESSGNIGTLDSCDIEVADLPEITWDSPLVTTEALVGSGVTLPNTIQDDDAITPGWQGTLQVTITPPVSGTLEGMSVQFSVDDVPVGSPVELTDTNGADAQASVEVDLLDAEDATISVVVTGGLVDVESELTGIVIDTAPPSAASDLQATIESRRETSVRLSWTAPNGVAGYDVVYLPVAADDVTTVIDESNWEDATEAPDAIGGEGDVVVHDLMIEQAYVFAVRPYDSSGNLGPITSTTSSIAAHFETATIAPPASGAPGSQWGYSVDASTDLNADGTADLVVGQKYGDLVYIYLGELGGTYPSVPNVTIVGREGTGFGTSVAVVGNIAGDGYEDIAIAAPEDEPLLGRVYVVHGRDWSNEVVDLSDGTNPTASIIDFPTSFPLPMHVVRLGDFDGDGAFDFGIHANAYGQNGACDLDTFENCDGGLLVVKGTASSSAFPATVTIPDDSARFEAYFPSSFGFYGSDWLLGITNLVGNRSGVLAAEYQAGVQRILTRNPSALGGFDEQLLDYGPPAFDENTSELIFDTEIGSYPAALTGSNTLAVQLTGARDGLRTTAGVVDLYELSATDTFGAAPYNRFATWLAAGESNNFGQILIGTRYSGRPSSYSLPFFGRSPEAPSLIMGGGRYANKVPKLFMVGPQTFAELSATTATQELAGKADVEYLLSDVPEINPDWTDDLGVPSEDADWHGGLGFAIRDMDGDGFADIGVTEWESSFDQLFYTGGIVILH